MRLPLLLSAPLAALLVGGAAPPPSVPLYRTFGRWFVACDNVRSCEARGFDEGTAADLRLDRDAGGGRASLALSAQGGFDPAKVTLDGKPAELSGWTGSGPSPGNPASIGTDDPGAVAAFIARARDGETITLDPAGRDDPRTIPLDGFTAALLLIDAVQGRAGTGSALIAARGDGVAPAAPPLPPAPVWRRPVALGRAESRRLLAEAGRLRSTYFDPCTVTDSPPEVHALDATHAVAIRPCYQAAYQGSSVVAVLPRRGGPARPVVLSLPGVPGTADDGKPTSRDATDGPDMVDPVFDPKTGSLVTVSKGRGLADCGSSESWVWSRGAFRLSALAYEGQCGGAGPGDWPVLYRTR